MNAPGAEGVDGAHKARHVQHAQQIQQVQKVQQVDQVAKLDKLNLQKLDKNLTGKGPDPVHQKAEVSKASSMLSGIFSNMETGQAHLDKLINGGLSGKTFSNGELLGLQAGMYKYSQELDLCSKVVEKATTGLKDTLKTQV
jgi:hypothetical protein